MDGRLVYVDPATNLIVYRASGLGGCKKALLAARLGYDEIYSGRGGKPQIFAEGELHENAVVDRMRLMGWEIADQQLEIVLQIRRYIVQVVGHIDGMARLHETVSYQPDQLGPWKLLEIKSMGTKEYSKFRELAWDTPGLIQKYKWQISCYMYALATEGMLFRPAILAVKNRDNGELWLENIDKPFFTFHEISARILEIEQWVKDGLGPEQLVCDVPNFFCPYSYLHEHDSEYELISDRDMMNAAMAYKESKELASMYGNKASSHRDTIVEGLASKPAGRYGIGGLVTANKDEKGVVRVYIDKEEGGDEFGG